MFKSSSARNLGGGGVLGWGWVSYVQLQYTQPHQPALYKAARRDLGQQTLSRSRHKYTMADNAAAAAAAPMEEDPPQPPQPSVRTLRPRNNHISDSLASPVVDNSVEDNNNEIVLLPNKACPKSDYDFTLYRFVSKADNKVIKVAMCADRKKERVVCQEEYDRGRDKWLRFCQDVKGKRVDGGGDIDVFGELVVGFSWCFFWLSTLCAFDMLSSSDLFPPSTTHRLRHRQGGVYRQVEAQLFYRMGRRGDTVGHVQRRCRKVEKRCHPYVVCAGEWYWE